MCFLQVYRGSIWTGSSVDLSWILISLLDNLRVGKSFMLAEFDFLDRLGVSG